MAPQKLSNMDREQVKDMDENEFRMSMLYDFESLKFWLIVYASVNSALLTLLIGVVVFSITKGF